MESFFNIAGPCICAPLAAYLDRLGLAEGWMPVFDSDPSKTWDERLFNRDVILGGKTSTSWDCRR